MRPASKVARVFIRKVKKNEKGKTSENESMRNVGNSSGIHTTDMYRANGEE